MLRLSKLTDYGTVIMTHMARVPGRTWSAAELAAAVGVGAPTASKILKLLVHAGLLCSCRGAKGGYLLARPPAEISLGRIVAAMEGPLAITECSLTEGLCAQESGCAIRHNWQRISLVIAAALEQVSLEDMVHPLSRLRLPGDARGQGRAHADRSLQPAHGGQR